MNKKFLSLVMVAVLAVTPFAAFAANGDVSAGEPASVISEQESTTNIPSISDDNNISKEEAQKKLEEQQKQLELNLAEAEKKLAELEKSSKLTIEYIDTLDQKIGYINEQLTILEGQNSAIQLQIDKLTPSIKKNEKELKKLSDEVEKAKKELDKLEKKFTGVYEAYCYRLRVMYISGDYNVLTAILTCNDISGFLTRYEMIKSIAKSDTKLLNEVQQQMDEIVTKQNGLDEQVQKYKAVKDNLDKQKKQLDDKQKTIDANAQSIASKKASLATDRAESDRLLAELTAQNQQYSEFRNEDEELIKAVENEVQALIAGIKSPDEVTTASVSEKKDSTTGVAVNKSDVYSRSDAVLNMTYPIPSCKAVSAGFPNYSSGKYHGGIDFPCPMYSNVVAAQDGIVITVKNLNYSYGHYVMIYHGTDKSGRSVVTLYAHNSTILVSNGQSVKKGQTIAQSGSTGNSTGPHCHFEIRFDGVRVNPKNYLS